MMMRPTSASSGGKWIKGGFQSKMDRKEAIQILGLRYVYECASECANFCK